MTKSYTQKGFTLIELLIVIVIIGILAGVVIAVMNPATQQRKAKESVLRANTDKICLAMHACASSRSDPLTGCNTLALIGATAPAVPNSDSSYTPSVAGNVITITGDYSAAAGDCVFTCTYDASLGTSTAVTPNANCLIQ